MLYVGIDTRLEDLVVCAIAADGQVVARTTVPNDQAGAEPWVAWLQRHAAPYARRQSLVMHMDTIRALEHQQQALDKVIARDMQAFRQTLTTIPGIGPVYGAGLLAEIGPIKRFPSENAWAKYAGLTWRPHQSGHCDADIRPRQRTGNVYLRYYCIEAAERVRVRDPQCKAFYAKKYGEATHHAHKRALVLTARKLVGVVYGMLTRGQIYDERKLRPR